MRTGCVHVLRCLLLLAWITKADVGLGQRVGTNPRRNSVLQHHSVLANPAESGRRSVRHVHDRSCHRWRSLGVRGTSRLRGGRGGGYHNFMNHKPWHPGSFKNLEEVWLLQQQEKIRQAKLKERTRILDEERKIERVQQDQLEEMQQAAETGRDFERLDDLMEGIAKVNVNGAKSPYELFAYGRMILARELLFRGMDTSGTVMDLAVRLFRVRGMSREEIQKMLKEKRQQKPDEDGKRQREDGKRQDEDGDETKTVIDQSSLIEDSKRKKKKKKKKKKKRQENDMFLAFCNELNPRNSTNTSEASPNKQINPSSKKLFKRNSFLNKTSVGQTGKKRSRSAYSSPAFQSSISSTLARMKAKELGLAA